MGPSTEDRECFHQPGKQQSAAKDKAPKRCALLFWRRSYQWTSRATRIPQKGEDPGQLNQYGYPFQAIEFVQGGGGGTNHIQNQRKQSLAYGESASKKHNPHQPTSRPPASAGRRSKDATVAP